MKALIFIVGLAVAWVAIRFVTQERQERAAAREQAAARVVPSGADPTALTQALRDELLHASWQQLGVRPRAGVWGLLMELGFAKGVASVVALADGTASLYLSNGGSVIGAGAHPKAHAAAISACQVAAGLVSQVTTGATTYPRPGSGRVRFYVLTDAGVRTAEADEAGLRDGKYKLSALYTAGQDVITGLRAASGLERPAP
jgi:hypothetical protein